MRRALIAGSLVAGCNAVTGVGDLDFSATSTSSGSGGSPGTTSSASSTASSSATSSTTGTGGTGGAGGGPVDDCWGLATAWSPKEPFDFGANAGAAPQHPRVSPDGLTLVYIAVQGAHRRPWRATRASKDAPWESHQPLLDGWPELPLDVNYPFLHGGELYLTTSDPNELYVAVASGDQFPDPTPMTGVNTQGHDAWSTLTADGSQMIFERSQAAPWHFVESVRVGGGPDFAPPVPRAVVPIDDTVHNLICPTVSPDGLRLFFASDYPETFASSPSPQAVTRLYWAERATLDAHFGSPVEVPTADSDERQTCPMTVSADGCELVFHHWDLGGAEGTQTNWITRRTPLP